MLITQHQILKLTAKIAMQGASTAYKFQFIIISFYMIK